MNGTNKVAPCAQCKFCYPIDHPGTRGSMEAQAVYECRRFPPSASLIMQPNRVQGGPPHIMKQSDFPNCWERCGEFVQKLQS